MMVNVNIEPLHDKQRHENDILMPDFIHCEPISFHTNMHSQIFKENIHNSFFRIIIIESGKLDLIVNTSRRLISGPAIITIPENTPHVINMEKMVKGKVLILSPSFFKLYFSKTPKAFRELSTIQIITEFDKPDSFEFTSLFMDSLYHEMKEDLEEKKILLQNHCDHLLSLIYRLLVKKSEKMSTPDSRNIRYFDIFLASIKQSYSPMKSIKQYAGELNITSVHLNRICQSTVRKSALQIVHEFLVIEAEKLLKQTDLNVSEIAYRLNFEDPAYFSRLFRKYTGISPKRFRENN